MYKKSIYFSALAFCCLHLQAQQQVSGFSKTNAATQVALEEKFDNMLSSSAIGETIKSCLLTHMH